jgi:hypothetical protein
MLGFDVSDPSRIALLFVCGLLLAALGYGAAVAVSIFRDRLSFRRIYRDIDDALNDAIVELGEGSVQSAWDNLTAAIRGELQHLGQFPQHDGSAPNSLISALDNLYNSRTAPQHLDYLQVKTCRVGECQRLGPPTAPLSHKITLKGDYSDPGTSPYQASVRSSEPIEVDITDVRQRSFEKNIDGRMVLTVDVDLHEADPSAQIVCSCGAAQYMDMRKLIDDRAVDASIIRFRPSSDQEQLNKMAEHIRALRKIWTPPNVRNYLISVRNSLTRHGPRRTRRTARRGRG